MLVMVGTARSRAFADPMADGTSEAFPAYAIWGRFNKDA
jgi:hypothetical protein